MSHVADQPALLPGFKDPTVRNIYQQSALHIASEESSPTVVEGLLKLECARQGSCVTLLRMKDSQSKIPLHSAVNDDVIKILLHCEMHESPSSSKPAVPKKSKLLHVKHKDHPMPLSRIGREKSGILLRWILDQSLVEQQVLDDLYRAAISSDNIKALEILFEYGADPNFKMKGNTSALSCALERGVRFEEFEGVANAFARAVRDFNSAMLDFLHSKGVPMDADYKVPGLTALSSAVTSERLDLIEFLLKRGADVNRIRGPGGTIRQTVLHRAAEKGNIKMAGLLLDHGADIDSYMSGGDLESGNFPTPLELAVLGGNREMAEFLMGKGADTTLLGTSARKALKTMLQT